ncbi:hypothetical protein ES703_97389 [subsurface metagenome]
MISDSNCRFIAFSCCSLACSCWLAELSSSIDTVVFFKSPVISSNARESWPISSFEVDSILVSNLPFPISAAASLNLVMGFDIVREKISEAVMTMTTIAMEMAAIAFLS